MPSAEPFKRVAVLTRRGPESGRDVTLGKMVEIVETAGCFRRSHVESGYIQSWIGLLKADKRAIFTACSKAQCFAGPFANVRAATQLSS
jgi:antirestriction protein ArdC